MAFNGFCDYCYFVPHMPLNRMWYKKEHLVWEDTDWCVALEKDIKENGMIAPILVDNEKPDEDPYHVRTGHHRCQALERLGWTHAPAVIWGSELDEDWEHTRIKTHSSLFEYFPATQHVWIFHGRIIIDNDMIPEDMVYPPNKDPYWSESSDNV